MTLLHYMFGCKSVHIFYEWSYQWEFFFRCFQALTPNKERWAKPTSHLPALWNSQEVSWMTSLHVPNGKAEQLWPGEWRQTCITLFFICFLKTKGWLYVCGRFLGSRRSFETLVWDTAVCCRKTPDPLSIEDVCQQKHVEVKFLFRLK